jgi:TonB family protein
MKKILFLLFITAAFLYGCASAESEKKEEKAETSGKIVARGLTTAENPHTATVNGALDKKVIEEHVRKILPKLRFCYENGVRKHPEIAGIIVLDFVIQSTGDVSESKVVSTTMNDSGVEKCVADQVGKIKFPVSKDASTVVYNYSFVFRNAVVEEKVSDNNKTVLLWSDRSPEKMTWNDAVNYCENLSEKGLTDWHLPNIDVLRKGIIGCSKTESGGECRVCEKNGCLSSDCKNPKGSCSCERVSNGSFYSANCDEHNVSLWSSSTLSDDPDSAWGVVFYSAMVGSNKKSGKFYARCVTEVDLKKESVPPETAVIMAALDNCTIDSYIRKSEDEINKCYEKELAKDPKLAGRVLVNFIISASGDVSSSKVLRTTLGNAEVENCVAEQIKKIKFPAPRGGGIVFVNHPFTFKNKEE